MNDVQLWYIAARCGENYGKCRPRTAQCRTRHRIRCERSLTHGKSWYTNVWYSEWCLCRPYAI